MNTDIFDMVAKTFQGLEDVLAKELQDLGAINVEPGRRMVAFQGNKALLYKANLHLRTALRVLKPFYSFKAHTPEKLYDRVKEFDWSTLLSPSMTFAIDVTVNSQEFTNSRFVTYKVKDAIADYFRDRDPEGRRPSVRLTQADVLINVHISGAMVTLSLDSSGESLHKRGWREAQTEAPINEVLAAGIILKSGWNGQAPLIDPMCGSGTFLVEAGLIAANIAPGIFRQHFAFMGWQDFDADLWDELYNDDSQERSIECPIIGADMSPKAIDIATQNIKRAGLASKIELQLKPLSQWTEAPANGVIITNPPYGERLKPHDLDRLYALIGSQLKHIFTGYNAWIIGYRDEQFEKIGLSPSLRLPLLNGSLECELRQYEIFSGSRKDFKSAGGKLKHLGNKLPARRAAKPHADSAPSSPRSDAPRRPQADPENPYALRRNPELLANLGKKPTLRSRGWHKK